jgi:DNA-binding transcriptional regulator YdaS (Cro superfamily)
MDIDSVIQHFGSGKAFQDALGVTKAAVSQWRSAGIPRLRQFQIQALTQGKFLPDGQPQEVASKKPRQAKASA